MPELTRQWWSGSCGREAALEQARSTSCYSVSGSMAWEDWTLVDSYIRRYRARFCKGATKNVGSVAEVVTINYNRAVSTPAAAELSPMIAHLSGTLLSKQATSVILDVGGVGYEITIPVSTFYDLEEPGANVQLRIYTHVREDALQLYGFKTTRERELFLRLISVSGIGPKLGITLLSGMSADEMIASIRTNNLARLTLIPGVGRKTAERLVMELRDKVASLSSAELEEDLGAKTPAGEPIATEDSMRSDVLSALLNLGYQRSSAEKAVGSAMDEGGDITVELILRRSLKKLAKA